MQIMQIIRKIFCLGKSREYEAAIELYNQHRYREAIAGFEILLKTKSESSLYHNLAHVYCGQAHRNLGIVLFATGNFSEALREFETAIIFNPDEAELYRFIGICQNNLGDFASAVGTFSRILEIDPENLPTRIRLGIALHNLKMWERAATLYSTILANRPGYADVHFRLGLACLGTADYERAAQAFKEAVTINPSYVEARKKLGITQTFLGRFEEALENFEIILARFPAYADMHYYAGIAHAGQNEITKAAEAFARALEINPSYRDAKIKLGILHCRKADYRLGLQQLAGASELDPADTGLKTAIDHIRTLVENHSATPEKLAEIIGQFFGGRTPFEQVVNEFNRHIEITPDFTDVLSIIKNFSDDDAALWKALIPHVQENISQNPHYPDLHNTLGTLYNKLGKRREAEECFTEALRLQPRYLQARINLLCTLQAQAKYQTALAQARLVIEAGVAYPDVYCCMGELHLALNNFQEAMRCADAALEINAAYSHAIYLRSEIFERLNDIDSSILALEHCLRSNPSRELLTRTRNALMRLRGK